MEKKHTNEEIDLGDLFHMINKVFNKIGLLFLRFINFLIRNVIILAVLIVIGVVLGYFLDSRKGKTYKTEVIIATDFDSGEYLYKAIEEVNYKLKTRDFTYFNEVGLSEEELSKISNLKVEPIVQLDELTTEQRNYISFIEESNFLEDEKKNNIFIRSAKRHKISLFHRMPLNSGKVLTNIVEKLRDNTYYSSLFKDYKQDIEMRLEANIYLIKNLDTLVRNYSQSLINGTPQRGNTSSYESENYLDMGAMLEQRSLIQQEVTQLREDNIAYDEFLKILDEGKVRNVDKIFFKDRRVVFYPLMLVLLFFGIILLKKVFIKAREIN